MNLKCSCGWEGKNTQLIESGCLTYGDTWWICPECRGGASKMERVLWRCPDCGQIPIAHEKQERCGMRMFK